MKIVADDQIPFLKGIFEPYTEVTYLAGDQIDKASVQDAIILIVRSLTKCDATLLEDTSVRLIATATIGDDHIDADYCLNKGIRWVNAKGCNADAVAQYVTAVLLELAQMHQITLKNKKLGIIGVGNIGTRIERIASFLGMVPLLYDPPRERREGSEGFVTMEDITENADFITLHVPLNREGDDKTLHFIGKQFFDVVRNTPFLINSARGPVVETEAAKTALQEGRIKGYVADVWENEPNVDSMLLQQATLSTPHIAGYSVEGKLNGTVMVARAVADFIGIAPASVIPVNTPAAETISMECKKEDPHSFLTRVYREICPIATESRKLKANPDNFSHHRKNYSLRRDNIGLTLKLKNCSDAVEGLLNKLEFTIEQT